ncbi:hypothetical protein [Anabaena lutea]|uniref:Uncharacterized protein n=1 Tax=Anabaena lutea FACHB-196 TaxID=2692881 RepID=A0ABR8FLR0_9NOST|nr:hypothetical protein [Anabaena lutea]MBD2571069.1 hypothetical protein [Anabaena lutea FACHB-196]
MEYVIVKVEAGAVTGYWDGSVFQANIDLSDVQGTVEDARFLQGSVQTQDLSFDVEYREANVTIVLV